MTAFLIKSTLSLLVFLLFYKLVLEREKMHKINRFLLIFALVFSVVIPFVSFELISENPIVKQAIPSYVLPEIQIGNQEVETTKSFLSDNFLWILYGFGFLVFLFRFVRNLTSLVRNIHKSEKIKKDGFTLVLIQDEMLPHSFWNYVFIDRNQYENNQIDNELFVHEKAHITQKHSLDILFVEVLQMVFWFNPLIYLYKKAIKLNHEFLADQKVNETFKEVVYYQRLLLQKAVGNTLVPIASNLNYSITKKRFIMMTKSTSTLNLISKTGFSFVLFFAMFFTFSVNAQQTNKRKIPKYEIPDTKTGKLKEVSKEEYKKYLKLMEEKGFDTQAYSAEVIEEESEKDTSVPHVTVHYDDVVAKIPKETLEYKVVLEDKTLPNEKAVYAVEVTEESIPKNGVKTVVGSYSSNGQEPVYELVEIMPEYPNGMNEFRKFIAKNFNAPKLEQDFEGKVYTHFIIEPDGTLSNIEIVRGKNELINNEVIRVLKLTEKWNPGIKDGKPVRVRYTLPVDLNISSK